MNRKFWILGAAVAFFGVGCATTDVEPTPEPAPATETEQTAGTEPTAAPAADAGNPLDRQPKDGDEVAVLETAQGKIILMFFPDKAPNHVARFKECITKGVYTGTYFHRVIPGFMIQGGDPNTKNSDKSDDGAGGYGSFLKAEFNDVKHVRGVLSTARTQDPNSAQSQFFIMHQPNASLDRQYTVMGKVVSGLEAVDKIVNLPRGAGNNPNDSKASTITKASLVKWPVAKS